MKKVTEKDAQKRISILYPSASTRGENKKLQVGAYCRVSTDSDEQLISYRAQLSHYKQYLSEHDEYVFADIYADEGVSGTNIKNRKEFLRMLEDCRAGKIDMIITKSVSRFGRNTVDCLNTIRELKTLGIDVYFEKKGIHTTRAEGELLLTLMMAVAEAESYNLSENIKWETKKV